ncbi:MAG: alpha/beta hydrolase [Rhodopseudomonas palustris]|uniref:Alpha/beta hydrolase n=1 Tax=Rhodopseudomonas palustris TaxID=1076 RepID=A0A933S3X6_RHOPL|nr:alpha/beta hydrolase [Rhodopseudomonas palustris]
MAIERALIDEQTTNSIPHYEPYGWQHWPDHPWWSYQFRRGLGETQEGGGAVSEAFLAAARMTPGDDESWFREWTRTAQALHRHADEAEAAGHIQTAQNSWLRAANYYRQAEFWLDGDDRRRLKTFELMESCSKKFIAYLSPAGEAVEVPYENGVSLCAYFVRSAYGDGKQPVLISMGGLDSIKDEMWFMQARGALQRGISVLMIDGPGQGGTLRRHQVFSRFDYEVPVGRCIDYLATRNDVDMGRIAVCGSSLGGYYAARAGSCDPRLAACISHGAIWDLPSQLVDRDEDWGLAKHFKWVMGAQSMQGVREKIANFRLEGVLNRMTCPYLIVHGGYDVLGVAQARIVADYAAANGVDVTFHLVGEEQTGADHCQHDNPTIAQEIIGDWLAEKFGIDERALRQGRSIPQI